MVEELAIELGRYASPSRFFLRVHALLHIHCVFLLARKNLLYCAKPSLPLRAAARAGRHVPSSTATTRAARRRPRSYSIWNSFLFSRRRRPPAGSLADPSADDGDPPQPPAAGVAGVTVTPRAPSSLTHDSGRRRVVVTCHF